MHIGEVELLQPITVGGRTLMVWTVLLTSAVFWHVMVMQQQT